MNVTLLSIWKWRYLCRWLKILWINLKFVVKHSNISYDIFFILKDEWEVIYFPPLHVWRRRNLDVERNTLQLIAPSGKFSPHVIFYLAFKRPFEITSYLLLIILAFGKRQTLLFWRRISNSTIFSSSFWDMRLLPASPPPPSRKCFAKRQQTSISCRYCEGLSPLFCLRFSVPKKIRKYRQLYR